MSVLKRNIRSLRVNVKITYYSFISILSTVPALRGAGHTVVLYKTCSVLLCVPEQPRVDNSSAGPNWEQLEYLV